MKPVPPEAGALTLELDFHDYWIAGSGSAQAPWLDEEVEKNSQNLPYFPGKALKGVLRDAVRCAQAWGWLPAPPICQLADGLSLADWPTALFGSNANEHPGLTPDQSLPASVWIADAVLPEAVQQALLARPDLSALLQRAIFFTAVTEQGVARDQSLRGMEVTIPITLQATVCATALAPPDWQQVLQRALPLVRALGKRRTRGFGRVTVRMRTNDQQAGAL